MTEPAKKPSRLERLRARYHWLDHAVRAGQRYQNVKGDFYAAAKPTISKGNIAKIVK